MLAGTIVNSNLKKFVLSITEETEFVAYFIFDQAFLTIDRLPKL